VRDHDGAIRRHSALLVVAWGLGACGCGGTGTPAGSPHEPQTLASATTSAGPATGGEPYVWQPFTQSPQRAEPAQGELENACTVRDAALERAAGFVAARELAGKPSLDAEDVTLVLRAEGAPYVWPHVWSLAGTHAGTQASARFTAWLAALPTSHRRCGAAVARDTTGREVVVGIALDVLADLEPLPTQANVGAWLDVNARLLVPASEVKVLVLGPRGRAHSVPSSLANGRVRARFHADREGEFLVQLLATVDGGPRPVAEAVVHAGAAPSALFAAAPAPGEEAGGPAPDADALARMVNAARASDGTPALRRDVRLDRVAAAHARAMLAAGQLAHDVGDGSPGDRVVAAGIVASAIGENVAHAADARHAHRTLWRSPSHRSNLLEPSYDTVGIGVAQGDDETLWVCEVFARVL
jgi:uncharacterized protein YkwD